MGNCRVARACLDIGTIGLFPWQATERLRRGTKYEVFCEQLQIKLDLMRFCYIAGSS